MNTNTDFEKIKQAAKHIADAHSHLLDGFFEANFYAAQYKQSAALKILGEVIKKAEQDVTNG